MSTTTTLPPNSELRFQVGHDTPGKVKLLSGSAELFGVELAAEKEYSLPPGKCGAIATFHGAKVETSFASEYAVTDPPTLLKVVEVHQRLEARREAVNNALRASSESKEGVDGGGSGGSGEGKANEGESVPTFAADAPIGPRVIVVGPEDSGKSTLCKTLLAYAARMGWCPLYVDCDLGQGELSVPGTVGASPVDRLCLSVEYGLDRLAPLVYFVGNVSAGVDTKLYTHCVTKLADNVTQYCRVNGHARASGVVINTMGWVDGTGYELLLATIRAFQADAVLVIGQDKLCIDLTRDLKGVSDWSWRAGVPTVEKLPRSEGVVSRSAATRKDTRKNRIREYFYGKDGSLGPHATTLSFDDVTIVKLTGISVDAMTMPVGFRDIDTASRVRASEVPITPELTSCLLGASFATTLSDVPNANIAGFIIVKRVDMESKTLEVLCPSSEPPPSAMFVRSSIQWTE